MSEFMACVAYVYLGVLFLVGNWIGFFLGVYASEVYAFLKKRLSGKGKL